MSVEREGRVAARAVEGGGGGTRGTILIVEDSDEGRDIYARALEAEGYRVVQASNGAEGVRLATGSPPDLVLMNLSLPLVAGVDAVEILKGHPATEHVPVIVVTGHTSPAIREMAWEAGCDEYHAKPLGPMELLGVVEAILGRRSS